MQKGSISSKRQALLPANWFYLSGLRPVFSHIGKKRFHFLDG